VLWIGGRAVRRHLQPRRIRDEAVRHRLETRRHCAPWIGEGAVQWWCSRPREPVLHCKIKICKMNFFLKKKKEGRDVRGEFDGVRSCQVIASVIEGGFPIEMGGVGC
jgi:hypothetical protein